MGSLGRRRGRGLFAIGVTVTLALMSSLALVLLPSSSSFSAETDVTDAFDIKKDRPYFDYARKQTYTTLTLTNISAESFQGSLRLVIDSITSDQVTVHDPDGFTQDGKPYFDLPLPWQDLDGNGTVDSGDLALLNADFGRTDCLQAPTCEGDFNGDGDVDGGDLALFNAVLGQSDDTLEPGETYSPIALRFDNPEQLRFDFAIKIFADVDEEPAVVWFVDGEALSGGNGMSWEAAFNSIRDGAAAASDGEEVWVKAGTYHLTNTITIDKAIRLYGGFSGDESSREQRDWEANVTTLSGEYLQGPGFTVTADATFDGFTVTGFCTYYTGSEDVGAAMQIYNASPTIAHCLFSHNRGRWGGAIYNSSARATIRDSAFMDNTAYWSGGGIYNSNGSSPAISRCVFKGNRSGCGGGICDWESSAQITQCTFVGNRQGEGSAIGVYEKSTPTISDSVFMGNYGEPYAINVGRIVSGQVGGDNSAPVIRRCTFLGNRGGAVGVVNSRLPESHPYVEDCVFVSNYYGCVRSGGAYLAIDRCTFQGNNSAMGAAIVNDGSFLLSGRPVTVANSRFDRNWAVYDGGAISNEQASMSIVNSLFIGNSARNGGGAIHNWNFSSCTISFSTFFGNYVDVPAGQNGAGSAISGAMSSPTVVRNCIFWENTPNLIYVGDINSGTSLDYSIAPQHLVGSWNHNASADPLFRDAARGDFRLLSDSPAIDTGTTDVPSPPGIPLEDLAGNDRVLDGDANGTSQPDMGPYEYVSGQYPDTPEPLPSNLPPVAKADAKVDDVHMMKDHQSQRTYLVGDTVDLDGTGSIDPDGDSLAHSWSLVHVPTGSNAVLSDPNGATPTFQIDVGGVYVVQLVVNDGQVDSTPDFVVVFNENQKPVANAGPDQTVFAGDPVQLDSALSYDPDGDYLTCFWEVTSKPSLSTVPGNMVGPRQTFVPDVSGTYVIRLLVRDIYLDGSTDSVTIYGQVSGDRPPVITSTPVTEITLGQVYRYQVTATAPDSGDYPLTFSLDIAPEGMTINYQKPGDIIWQPRTRHIGPNNVKVLVVDQHASYSFQEFIINVADDPPRITSTPVTQGSEGQLYSYRVRVTNTQGSQVLTFSLDVAPAGMTIDASGQIRWTPTYTQSGGHNVTVRVVESAELFDTQQFIITVDNVNQQPVITSTPEATASVGQLYSYDLEASDPDEGETLTFSLLSAPRGMIIHGATGLITWTPTQLQVGNHEVVVQARDPHGLSVSQNFQITVTGVNDPPVITSSPVVGATEFHPYEYLVEATDPDFGDILTFSLDISPPGMTINTRTGLIQWTPISWKAGATSMIGDHDVTVRVQDAGGLFHIQRFTIRVEGAQAGVRIEALPETLSVPVGTSASISYTVTLQASSPGAYTVQYAQGTNPDDNGLSLQLEPPSGWNATGSAVWLTSQVVTGNTVGTYEITTSATVNETGLTDEVTTVVHVISAEGNPFLYPMGSDPKAISISTPTDVIFTTWLSGSEPAPTDIVVEEVDDSGNAIRTLGALVDDGTVGDLLSGDRVYSGTFSINSNTEGQLYFRATATYTGIADPVHSETCALGVTRFPTDIEASDFSKIVVDPNTGDALIGNEILVSFVDGTDPGEIEAIVHSIGGTIIGTIYGLGYYQISIPDTDDAAKVYGVINNLSNNPRVRTAEPVYVGSLAAVVPSDTHFVSQWGLVGIRADEAWVNARKGEMVIAVLDSGVDYDHPDLAAKIIRGRNFTVPRIQTQGRQDPKDDNGHGTHVAGIASAVTDNATGIAGVSWGSKILAVKVSNATASVRQPALARAIEYAANRGARIINMSLGWYAKDSSVLDAIEDANAQGALIVAAAGNDNTDRPNYPAAFPGVLSVGATDSSDLPWLNIDTNSATNFGNWVKIAAPGAEIFSTMPTYHVTLNDPPHNLSQEYANCSGTSMATPMVSGAAAVIWSRYPFWTAQQVRDRLVNTAEPIDGSELGAGRIDLFGGVFNGSFEHAVTWTPPLDPETMWGREPLIYDAELFKDYGFNPTATDRYYYRPSYKADFPRDRETEWYFLGYEDIWWAYTEQDSVLYGQGGGFIPEFGILMAPHGRKMAYITTGRQGETYDFIMDYANDTHPCLYLTFLEKRFRIQPGQTELPISLTYDFVSEEGPFANPPNWQPGEFNGDGFQISLEIDGPPTLVGYLYILAHGQNFDSELADKMTPLPTTPSASLPAGDFPLYHSDWQPVTARIPLPPEVVALGGMATLRFTVFDKGGGYYPGGIGSDSFGVSGDSALFIDDIHFR